jgi:hypothetical protein
MEDNNSSYSNEATPDNIHEEVQKWNDKISIARKWRDDICARRRWKEMINEYKGQWELADGRYDIQILPINLVFAYIKTELPSLYIRDPHIKINPKNRTSVATSKVLESVINYIWYYKKIKREIKKCIVDALLIGHGWFKTGYTGTFGSIEDDLLGTIETIESEDFFAYRLPWDSIVFDPDSIDPPHDAAWIAHSVWLPLEDVKKNPRYKNTHKLTANYSKDDKYNENQPNKNQGKCRLTEVWDVKNKTVFTISEGCDDYIEDPKPWPLAGRGFPFSYLKFNFSNDDPYGISDVAMFEPQVLELIKVRSAALDHLKRYNRQMQIDPSVPDDEANKLAQNVTGSYVRGDTAKPLAIPITFPNLPADTYAIEERIKEDMINVSGQSPAERGATQKTSTRTKAELIFQRQGAENRRSEKIDLVEDFVEGVASNLIELVKQFANDPYYVSILGANSPDLLRAIQERPSSQGEMAVTAPQGFTFTKEDIEGEFDVEVVSGSSTPIDRAELTKVLMELLEIGPKAGAIPGGPLMGTVAKMLIETIDLPELTVALEAEQQAQDQMKQQQAQQAEEAKQLSIASQGAESQIDAANAATKQNKVLVDFIKAMGESKRNQQEAENSRNETENDMNIEVEKLNKQMEMDETKLLHDLKLNEAKTAHSMKLKEQQIKQQNKNKKKSK